MMESSDLDSINSPRSHLSTTSTKTTIHDNKRMHVSAFSSLADLKARQRLYSQKLNCNIGNTECVYEVVPGAHRKTLSREPNDEDLKVLGLYSSSFEEPGNIDCSSDNRNPNDNYQRERLIYDYRSEPCHNLEDINLDGTKSHSDSSFSEEGYGRWRKHSKNKNTKNGLKVMKKHGSLILKSVWNKVRPMFVICKAKRMFHKKEVVQLNRAKGTLL